MVIIAIILLVLLSILSQLNQSVVLPRKVAHLRVFHTDHAIRAAGDNSSRLSGRRSIHRPVHLDNSRKKYEEKMKKATDQRKKKGDERRTTILIKNQVGC